MIQPTRGLITEALTETGWPVSSTFVSDGGGGGSVTLVSGGTVSCRVDALGGAEGEVAERISDRSSHLITLPPETTVTIADDFVISGRGTFEITAVREHTGELSRALEAVPR